MKKTALILFCLLLSIQVLSQEKKVITHETYDIWKSLSQQKISPDGRYITYNVKPINGKDGFLVIYDIKNAKSDTIYRAEYAKFDPEGRYLAFRIKAGYDTTRKAKLAKKKKKDWPKDSLGIWVPGLDSIQKFPGLKSFSVPERSGDYLAAFLDLPEKKAKKKDTIEKKKAKPKKKKKGAASLLIIDPLKGTSIEVKDVSEYALSEENGMIGAIRTYGDSIDSCSFVVFIPKKKKTRTILEMPGKAVKPAFSKSGDYFAMLYSSDTSDHKSYKLMAWENGKKKMNMVADSLTDGIHEGMCPSEFKKPYFSENGNRLFFGLSPIPRVKAKDTLLPEEKVRVDVWSWTDPLLQPQQLKNLKKEQKRTYTAIYNFDTEKVIALADTVCRNIYRTKKGDGNYFYGYDKQPYQKSITWESPSYKDIFVVDPASGKRKLILKKQQYSFSPSFNGNYLAYWTVEDSTWNIWSAAEEVSVKYSIQGKPLYNEDNDTPSEPYPYGIAGWTKDDAHCWVYDRYDIWQLQTGKKGKALNLTMDFGRQNQIKLRIVKTDPDKDFFIEGDSILLLGFDEKTKENAYYYFVYGSNSEPQKLIDGKYRYTRPLKAKNANLMVWRRYNYQEYPDLWLSDTDFSNSIKISNANPQKDDYLWGQVELVKWEDFKGEELEGLLYKPENFDPNKKYPVIVYFYEKYSDDLHRHYYPKPSYSTVNFTYFASNGYLVFVPDISYTTGYPGKDAYNAVVSGTKYLMSFPWVDSTRMGIQGQSWGGYQVAWLVTQTGIYRAAGAGAPVSNMTSAYGGIRWGSGLSRAFQYEVGQSRIGATLWENRERYINNSPVFFADKISTPLLIMHNDNDGAVPWYQGIELFSAMRRLDKEVWMLVYNGEEHNLTKWPNRVDLSIRLGQFFDFYLKGKPAPPWMKDGIPAIQKGKTLGY